MCSNLPPVCHIYSHKHALGWNTYMMSTELNEVDGTDGGWWGGCCCCCYRARSVDDKIIRHELLMSWIIARFHGYGPTECGLLSEWRRERRERRETAVARLKQARNRGNFAQLAQWRVQWQGCCLQNSSIGKWSATMSLPLISDSTL